MPPFLSRRWANWGEKPSVADDPFLPRSQSTANQLQPLARWLSLARLTPRFGRRFRPPVLESGDESLRRDGSIDKNYAITLRRAVPSVNEAATVERLVDSLLRRLSRAASLAYFVSRPTSTETVYRGDR